MNRKGKGKILDRRRPWLYSNKIGARVNGLQVEASEHGAGVIEKSLWGRSGIIICIWFASDYFGFAWEIKRESPSCTQSPSPPVSLSPDKPSMENKTSGAAKVLSLSGAARKHTSATISAVDDDGAGHAGCMLDLPSAHRSNLLNSSMLPFSLYDSLLLLILLPLTVHEARSLP